MSAFRVIAWYETQYGGVGKVFADMSNFEKWIKRQRRSVRITNNGEEIGGVNYDDTQKCWVWVYDEELARRP